MPEGANVGTAYVTLLPEVRGFQGQVQRQIGGPLGGAGKDGGKRFGGAFTGGVLGSLRGLAGPMTAILGAAGIGAVIKSSVQLEAEFSKTMNTMGAVADVPAAELRELSKLAVKMGADTAFSANEAAGAMLELAKGGMEPAVIQGGALQATLTLAAASGSDLTSAAETATTAMVQFGIAGKDMNQVAAALAGGANASTASIESLAEGLGQGGSAAAAAGFTLQETVATLAALDLAGAKGSDGGTSLKTALDRLQPTTKKASAMMQKLGLDFTNADGTFKDVTEIAGQLQKELGGLPEAQRKAAVSTIFGSDAQRFANAMIKQGSAGMQEMIASASDMEAANRAAAARTSGTAGALERMSGSLETAQLGLGRLFAPAVVAGADLIGKGANAAAAGVDKLMASFSDGGAAGAGAFITPLVRDLQGFGRSLMPIVVEGGAALKSLGGTMREFGAAMLPVLTEIGGKIVAVVGPAIRDIGGMITGQLIPAFQKVLPIVQPVAKFLLGVLGSAVVGALKGVVNVVKGVLNVVIGIFNTFSALFTGNWRGVWDGLKQIVSGAFRAVFGVVQVYLNVGILAIFKKGVFALRGLWTGLWNGLKGAATSGLSLINRLVFAGMRALFAPFRALGSGALNLVRGMWTSIRGVFSSAINFVKGLVTGGFRMIVAGVKLYVGVWMSIIRTGTGVIRNVISGAMNFVRSTIGRAWNTIKGLFTSAWSGIKSIVGRGIDGMKSAVTGGIDNVVGFFRGLPGKITGALGNAGSMLLDTGKNIVSGLIDGIKNNAAAIGQALIDLLPGPLKKFAGELGIASPSRVFAEFGRYIVEGFALGIIKSASRAEAAVDRLGVLAARAARADRNPRLLASVKRSNAALLKLSDERERVMKRLAEAQKGVKAAPELEKSVREGIMGSFNVAGMGGEVGAIRQRLAAAVTNTRAFQRNLDALRKRGLNKTALAQIIEAGVEQGGATAEGLVRASAADLAGINKLQSQLGTAAKKTGVSASQAMYGAGASAAKGLVNALAKEQKNIEKQMMKIAQGMKASIKKALGIRSPSRVFANIGADVAAGFAAGILGGSQQVATAAGQLAGAATVGAGIPRTVIPAPVGLAGAGGVGASVTVYADVRETADIDMLINRMEFEARAGGFG